MTTMTDTIIDPKDITNYSRTDSELQSFWIFCILVAGKNSDIINHAKEIIKELVQDIEKGQVYDGKVVKIMNFGAFVELLPGKEALLHISKIAEERVENVEDYFSIGDRVKVKVMEIDKQGRPNLARIYD